MEHQTLSDKTAHRREKPRWKNERGRVWRKGKDWSWVFAQRIIEETALQLGADRTEVERFANVYGRIAWGMLVQGHGVSLPGMPVLYAKRQKRKRLHNIQTGRSEPRNISRLQSHIPQRLMEELAKNLVERVDLSTQYKDEFQRLNRYRMKSLGPSPKKTIPTVF